MTSSKPDIWGIDADILVYAVGHAAGEDPLHFATHSFRERVNYIMEGCGCAKAQLFLSGKTNYRHDYCTDYKANRSDAAKPHHADALREFAVDTLDAIVADNEEADDLLGIHAVRDGWGIATIDKDLKGVPGWHYSWQGKDEGIFYVSEVEADRFFYTQLLTGDATDNIQGLFKRTGVKAMAKAKDPLQEMTDVVDMYAHVKQVYLDACASKHMLSDEGDVTNWLTEQGRALWIRREVGQIWEPPRG